MVIPSQRLKPFVLKVLPALLALAVLLTSLVLVSNVQQADNDLNQKYIWVLVLTVFALLVLLVTILHNVLSLARKVRHQSPGALLSARWVGYFLVLSLPPALIVYAFSAYFLTHTVDNWFDVDVENALADSLQLGQQFLDNRTLEVRNQVRRLGRELGNPSDDTDRVRRTLLQQVSAAGPLELSLFTTDGNLLATANINLLADLPQRPDDHALLQAIEQGEYAAAEPVSDAVLRIRVIERLPSIIPGSPGHLLQAIYPLPDNITALAGEIEAEYHHYQNISYLRSALKQSFILILSLVLLLTVLMAILVALKVARRLVTPISGLALATREVAAGDLSQAVESGSRDELGFLVQSFNEMTAALTAASEEAERSRAQLQSQSEYLATVLGSLTAGVLTLDHDQRVVTANAAATQILGLPEKFFTGQHIADLVETAPFLSPFAELIGHYTNRAPSEWQREIRLAPGGSAAGRTLVLLVRGSVLGEALSEHGGLVVVFDDVTVLNQAQRQAAWADVAQRLAHEVRNPLTPIRLAAERLRMKLLDKLDGEDSSVLERATGTIVSQVEALRTLVDAFGDYASEPELVRRPLQLDELIRDVVALYEEGNQRVTFDLDLLPGPPGFAADAGQIRQLLHNLISNACEAPPDTDGAVVHIRTSLRSRAGRRWLEIGVTDQGPGFPSEVLDKPFEPHVTFKPGGSGLGLAICHKIVLDHDGQIRIENLATGGAGITVTLPM